MTTQSGQKILTGFPNGGLIPVDNGSAVLSSMRVTSGTFVANGATPVVVAAPALTAGSIVIFTLKTVGGAVGAYPAIQTITPGTGFTVAATAADTSTYNYVVIG